ncbi:MAG: prepilin-type N-terminal cleavage/methylation domain-containing protein [Oceanisphaera sp.]|uniref:type IV pilus modification PilV family protein n=1 Tax=Oceanisphaera sp. TaxID=1929979 RepID=UPI003C755F5C
MQHPQRGFSLIEAMVALVILAGASLALFGWLSTSLNQLNRAALYTQAAPALQSMTSYLQMQDLKEKPTGTFEFGEVQIDWQASTIKQDENNNSGQISSNFLLSLYEVELLPTVRGRSLPVLHTRVVNYQLKPGAGQNPFG